MEYSQIARAAFTGAFLGCLTVYLLKAAIQYLQNRSVVVPIDPLPLKEDDSIGFAASVKYAPVPKGKKLSPKIQTDAKAAAFERIESEKALMRMGDEP